MTATSHMQRRTWLLAAAALAVSLMAGPVLADPGSIRATAILASPAGSGSDARLASIEGHLRRVFSFKRYEFLGEGRSGFPASGAARIGLGRGGELTVQRESGMKVTLTWVYGGQTVINTRVTLSAGAPVILGGASTGEGTLIIAVAVE